MSNIFASAVNYGVRINPNYVTVDDFNRDGKQDIANNYGSNTVFFSILLGSGDGTFRSYISYNVRSTPWEMVTADFNHDGKVDIVHTHFIRMQMQLLYTIR
ncbi:MAG: VCBS repeat-containing protein [Candidatus Midichloria sp.]|nr:VCBS repeat-containing protein [Candidatus Midichloria sp.]